MAADTSTIDICSLWQFKEEWHYFSLNKVLLILESNIEDDALARNSIKPSYFDFLNKAIEHPIKRVIKALIAFIKYCGLVEDVLIYDLKGYEAEFSFADPPILPLYHLEQALKTIYHTPEELEKFGYIGFKREWLEKVLGFSLLNREQQAIIDKLNKLIMQNNALADDLERGDNGAISETKDQIIVSLMAALAEAEPKAYMRGKRINKTQFARKCAISKMSHLFKHPKGEEAYRAVFSQLDISF